MVVSAGTTTADPETGKTVMSSISISGEMVTSVTLVVAQVMVVKSPALIVAGVAVMLRVGPGAAVTSSLAEVETDPFAPRAVARYVVDCAGETVVEPLGGKIPRPLSITTSLALVLLHVRVALFPAWMVAGETASVTVGVSGAGFASAPPPQPVMEIKLVMDAKKASMKKRNRARIVVTFVPFRGTRITR